jgi:hypothetical protein
MTAKQFAMERNGNKGRLTNVQNVLIDLLQGRTLIDEEKLLLEAPLSAVRIVLTRWDENYLKAKKRAGVRA